jgi:hypothetical protein
MSAEELIKWRKRCEAYDWGGNYIKPREVLPLVEELERRMGVPTVSLTPPPSPPAFPNHPSGQGFLPFEAPIPEAPGSESGVLHNVDDEPFI